MELKFDEDEVLWRVWAEYQNLDSFWDIFTGFESKIFSVLFILCVYYNKFLQELI